MIPSVKDRAKEHTLIQIVDSALADAARRSGDWLVCRPGCTQCCIGVFPINQLDAARLRRGLAELETRAPHRASCVPGGIGTDDMINDEEMLDFLRGQAREAVARLSSDFPGDPLTGLLHEADESFSEFANHEPCPALDPETGNCDLYEFRPMTCRVFGPPVRSEENGLGVCELCYQGASDEMIASCEMNPDPDDLESALLKQLEAKTGLRGNTIIAFCLAS